MDKDIIVGKKILNKTMKGNPFRQLSLLRQAVEMNTNLIQLIIETSDLQDSEEYQNSLPLIDKLKQSNEEVNNILKQEYPDEF